MPTTSLGLDGFTEISLSPVAIHSPPMRSWYSRPNSERTFCERRFHGLPVGGLGEIGVRARCGIRKELRLPSDSMVARAKPELASGSSKFACPGGTDDRFVSSVSWVSVSSEAGAKFRRAGRDDFTEPALFWAASEPDGRQGRRPIHGSRFLAWCSPRFLCVLRVSAVNEHLRTLRLFRRYTK